MRIKIAVRTFANTPGSMDIQAKRYDRHQADQSQAARRKDERE
jgi:hypothetical protein